MTTKSEERCLPLKEHTRRITTRPQLCYLFSKYLLLQRHASAQLQENCNFTAFSRYAPQSLLPLICFHHNTVRLTLPCHLWDCQHHRPEKDLCPIISVCVDQRCHTAHSWRGEDEVMTHGRTVKSSVNTRQGTKTRGSPPSPGGSQHAASCRALEEGGSTEQLDSQWEVVL